MNFGEMNYDDEDDSSQEAPEEENAGDEVPAIIYIEDVDEDK